MNAETLTVYQELTKVASSGSITNYSEVGNLIGLDMNSPADRNRISEILDEISRAEHQTGNPMLSAVVVLKDQNIPGEGFFKLAKCLSKQGQEEDLVFWLGEVKRVHDTWAIKQ